MFISSRPRCIIKLRPLGSSHVGGFPHKSMRTTWHGNALRITDPLRWESTAHIGEYLSQRASDAELDIFFFFHPDQAAEKTCRVDDVMIVMTQKKRKKEDFNDASG